MRKKSRSASFILPKQVGWIVLALLLLLDTLLDVVRGTQGNPLFKPIENAFGIIVFPLLVPFVLVGFYFVVKAVGWPVKKFDKFPRGEELVLSVLVVIFALHDLLIIVHDFFGVQILRSYAEMILLYTVVGIAYGWFAEYYEKKTGKI